MKSFEDTYQAWINETIAEAKKFVTELQKEDRSLRAKSANAKTRSFAPARNNFADNIKGNLNIRLTA